MKNKKQIWKKKLVSPISPKKNNIYGPSLGDSDEVDIYIFFTLFLNYLTCQEQMARVKSSASCESRRRSYLTYCHHRTYLHHPGRSLGWWLKLAPVSCLHHVNNLLVGWSWMMKLVMSYYLYYFNFTRLFAWTQDPEISTGFAEQSPTLANYNRSCKSM